jgi:branched-chain amino acid transport system permease protein
VTRLIQTLIDGLSIGAVYALLALGYVIIFKATEVVTFAQGGLLLLGGYFTWWFEQSGHGSLAFFPALVAGILVAVAVAVAVERLLVRRMQSRVAGVVSITIMTLGLNLLFTTYVNHGVVNSGSETLSLNDPWGLNSVSIGSITIFQTRLWALIIGMLIIAALFAWIQRSTLGVAMRAVAEDREAASLMGIRLGRVSMIAWAIAGGLATLGAVFLTAPPSPGFDSGAGGLALAAFPAAIVGGLDSTTGALAGGLVIGVSVSLFKGYESDLAVNGFNIFGGGFSDVVPYVVMLLVLLVRPTGLLGTRSVQRA